VFAPTNIPTTTRGQGLRGTTDTNLKQKKKKKEFNSEALLKEAFTKIK